MEVEIKDITLDNVGQYGVCGYKNPKKEGFPEKVNWIKENLARGLTIKALITPKDGCQGMIEYLPGENCWRPVNAMGYMFIHCLFAGFKNVYKNSGWASALIDKCIEDAKQNKKSGVAVVTRKGSFMADNRIFINKGFEIVEKCEPDFELLVLKFDKNAQSPSFKKKMKSSLDKYSDGLYILRSFQCPYTVKNVNEMAETAKNSFGIDAKIITYSNPMEAQEAPCPFGSFGLIYNGRLLAHHPISNTRFVNIMKTVQKRG